MEKAGAELAGIREIPKEEAEELVYHYIHQVIDSFQNMDEILSEINRKNTQYQRAAINRAKFYLIGGEDVRGQIKEILSTMNEEINRGNMELGGIYRLEFMDELIRIYSSAVLDEKSFYTPVEGKKTFEPEVLQQEEADAELRNEKIRRMLEKLAQVLNPEKIDGYVEKQLGDRKEMQASELPLQNTDDFVKLIYVRLYGQRKNMKYTVSTKNTVQRDGYQFTDFAIQRKEHK